MAYLDYSLVQLPDQSEGLRRVGDALEAAMKRRDQRRQFEETQKFQREQEDRRLRQQDLQNEYQNRIIDSRENREKREFGWREAEMQRRAAADARKSSGPQEAEAIAVGAGGTFTPGELPDVGPAPTAPGEAPQAPPEIQAAAPDILQALRGVPGPFRSIPGAPPELAARMKGLKRPQPEAGAVEGPLLPNIESVRSAEIQRIASQPDSEEVPDVEAAVRDAEAAHNAQLGQVRRYESQFEPYQQEMERPRIAEAIPSAEKFQAEMGDYQGRVAAFPGEQRAYAAKQREAEGRRPYSIQFGDKPPQTFDFQTQRTAAKNAAADAFLESHAGLAMNERDRAAMKFVESGIRSGTIKPEQATVALQRERMQGTRASDQSALQNQKDIEAMKRTQVMASRKPSVVLSERRFEASQSKDIRKETRKDVTDWLKAAGLETAPKQYASMAQSLRQLDGNPKEVQAALVLMGRNTQGDNRFSDKDYKVFVENGGVGALDGATNTIQKLIDGDYGDETKEVSKQMARALKAVYEQRLRDAAADGRDEFVHNEIYDPQVAESVLEQRLGRDFFKRESNRGGQTLGAPPEVKARAKGKAGRSTTIKAPDADTALKLREAMQ